MRLADTGDQAPFTLGDCTTPLLTCSWAPCHAAASWATQLLPPMPQKPLPASAAAATSGTGVSRGSADSDESMTPPGDVAGAAVPAGAGAMAGAGACSPPAITIARGGPSSCDGTDGEAVACAIYLWWCTAGHSAPKCPNVCFCVWVPEHCRRQGMVAPLTLTLRCRRSRSQSSKRGSVPQMTCHGDVLCSR